MPWNILNAKRDVEPGQNWILWDHADANTETGESKILILEYIQYIQPIYRLHKHTFYNNLSNSTWVAYFTV